MVVPASSDVKVSRTDTTRASLRIIKCNAFFFLLKKGERIFNLPAYVVLEIVV